MDENNFLDFIKNISQNPFEVIKQYTLKNRPMMGYMCTYIPEELVYASGLLPIRLLGRATQIRMADRNLQAYCCSQVRGFWEDFLLGHYKNLLGVLFAHICDTMQSFYDIFKMNNPNLFVFNLNFPSKLEGQIPFDYAMSEMNRFRQALQNFTSKKISEEDLINSVQVYNKNRELLSHLYSLHALNPELFPSVVLLRAVLASLFMDKKDLNPPLEYFLNSFGSTTFSHKKHKKIMLVGSTLINEDIYNLIDEFGGAVIDDNLCTGRRYFDCVVDGATDEQILRRYFVRSHCPSKHLSKTSRGEYILKLAQQNKIDGVIFIHLKFCDPHAFDYPYINEMLNQSHIHTHLIEIEQGAIGSEQLRTKIQGFMETL